MGVREYSKGSTNGAVSHVGESANYPLNVSEKHTGMNLGNQTNLNKGQGLFENRHGFRRAEEAVWLPRGRRLAKRTWLCTKTTLFDETSFMQRGAMQSSEDYEDMQDIRLYSMARLCQIQDIKRTACFENKNDAFPMIGSRVRRGPDWMFDDQDSYGPGTVVGHSEHEYKVWVTWDIDNATAQYRYGMGEYDVLTVDEPRELKPGEKIAIGCRVKPGRDARSKDLSGSIEGVVIRINATKAEVRWDNGKRGDYRYGADVRHEIELCSPNGHSGDYSHSRNTSARGTKTRSDKNKKQKCKLMKISNMELESISNKLRC